MVTIENAHARLVLVDDHPLFRMGLRVLLERDPRFEVIADVGSASELVEIANAQAIDLAVIDLVLPERGGAAATSALRRIQPACRVIGVSMIHEPYRIAEMIRAGADGFALKTQPPEAIVEAVSLVLGGVRYLPPEVAADQIERLVSDARSSPLGQLTVREREVFDLLAGGQTNDDIAARLFIARRTVETHRHRVLHKLGARSVVELLRIALRHGVIGE